MDNQNMPNQIPENKARIAPEKIIIVVFLLIIMAEIVWVGYSFINNKKIVPQTVITTKVDVIKKPTSINLIPEKIETTKGEKFGVTIQINSDIYSDGADILLSFDPKVISVVNRKQPVKIAEIYTTYPQNNVDVENGIITVSGVTDKRGGVLANGIFGTIEFVAKSSGRSKISIDFTKGSTIDSNIISSESGIDSLESVKNTEVNILP